ncbi:hypothetical protein QTP88_022961 [Uroleucon formosanum]
MSDIRFSKPIYVGFAVLEISKELMYDYHYNVMHYNDSIRLLYMDTDSLIYRIHTEDFYKDLFDKPALLERMDTSNLPATHPCYIGTRKKIPGLFKDETASRTMYEFIALRAKSYAYKIEGDKKLVAKGIRGHVVRNHMTFEHHKRCLFEVDDDDGASDGSESEEVGDDYDDYEEDDFDDDATLKSEELKRRARLMTRSVISTIHENAITAAITVVEFTPTPLPPYTPYTMYRENVSIRSFEHRVKTIKTMKITLNRFDDKRVVDDDRIPAKSVLSMSWRCCAKSSRAEPSRAEPCRAEPCRAEPYNFSSGLGLR